MITSFPVKNNMKVTIASTLTGAKAIQHMHLKFY